MQEGFVLMFKRISEFSIICQLVHLLFFMLSCLLLCSWDTLFSSQLPAYIISCYNKLFFITFVTSVWPFNWVPQNRILTVQPGQHGPSQHKEKSQEYRYSESTSLS